MVPVPAAACPRSLRTIGATGMVRPRHAARPSLRADRQDRRRRNPATTHDIPPNAEEAMPHANDEEPTCWQQGAPSAAVSRLSTA